jgi:hypothetical protein
MGEGGREDASPGEIRGIELGIGQRIPSPASPPLHAILSSWVPLPCHFHIWHIGDTGGGGNDTEIRKGIDCIFVEIIKHHTNESNVYVSKYT